ncbi:MAG: response regulator [Ignavibacteria bacterium]|nr:response regulator [Ignavibacteria bacterium]
MAPVLVQIIDDEPQIRKVLRLNLEAAGYVVMESNGGNEGCSMAAANPPHIIVLDLGLPDRDGISVLREIRSWADMPVIILSVKNTEEVIIRALDYGADDYMTKPFSPAELIARIRANIRRAHGKKETTFIENGSLKIDLIKRLVYKNDEEVKVTNTEFQLLALFFENIGKVLTQNIILNKIWGADHSEDAQYLRVFIGQIRKKIEDIPARPKYILTESGVGYRMVHQD